MDRNKIHIDNWVKKTLSNEMDSEGVHQSWEKMSALLDSNESKPKAAFWLGRGGIFSILIFTLLSTLSGVAIWNHYYQENDEITSRGMNNATSRSLAHSHSAPVSVTADGLPVETVENGDVATASHNSRNILNDDIGQVFTDAERISKNNNTNQHKYNPTQNNKQLTHNSIQNDDKKTTPNNHSISVNDQNSPVNSNGSKSGDNINNDHLLASSINNDLPKDVIKQHNIDSLKKVMEKDIKNKNIAYSIKKDEIGRIKTVNIKETHEEITYPNVKNNDNKPVVSIKETKQYKAIKLIPLTEIEKFVLQSFSLELLNSEDEDIRYITVVNKQIESNNNLLAYNSNKTSNAGHINSKSNSGSLLKDINNYFNFRKNFYTTLNMGFNSTPGNWFPLGFQFGGGVHYYISDKLTLGLEGLYSFRNTNFSIEDNKSEYTILRTGHTGMSSYYDYEDKSMERMYNVRYLESFQFPVMLSYHTPKVSYGLGPVIAFSSNIKYNRYDRETSIDRRLIADTSEAFPLVSNNFTYTESDFRRNILIGLNAGVHYNLNSNVGLTFRYSQLFWDNGKTSNVHSIMKQTFKTPEIRLGIQYRLGKTKRVQYMLMPSGSK